MPPLMTTGKFAQTSGEGAVQISPHHLHLNIKQIAFVCAILLALGNTSSCVSVALGNAAPPHSGQKSPSTVMNVGMIIGSTRPFRVGEQVGAWIAKLLKEDPKVNVTTLDLRSIALPLYNEPRPSKQITPPSGYAHNHTKAWSALVDRMDAFLVVTPDYNGYFPGGLKDAFDYLYHEWQGKPVSVVSYAHKDAGRRSAGHLTMVLRSLGLKPTAAQPAIRLDFNELTPKGLFKDPDTALAGYNGSITNAVDQLKALWEPQPSFAYFWSQSYVEFFSWNK